MSKLGEIEAVLPQLSDEELVHLDRTLHRLYRDRHSNVLYDDQYGLYSDSDLIASAQEAFQAYDKEEEGDAKRPAE